MTLFGPKKVQKYEAKTSFLDFWGVPKARFSLINIFFEKSDFL
jgi:hypothetical protein